MKKIKGDFMTIPKIPGRIETIKKFKESRGKIAAIFPIHYPRALFRAYNILPVEVWGPTGADTSYSTAYLQPYVCSIAQSALAYLLTGDLDITDIVVAPHTCDSLQGLGSILLDFIKPKQSVITIYYPRDKRDVDVEYLANEFKSVGEQLSKITGIKLTDKKLKEAIIREEEADDLLKQLYENKVYLDYNDTEFYKIIRAREYLPAEEFTIIANEALQNKTEKEKTGIPIIVTGIVPEPKGLLKVINELNGRIVADDFACCGRKLYVKGKSSNPYKYMAESLIFAVPDSSRENSINDRANYLVNLAKKYGAKGVLIYEVKFCEMELYYIPQVRERLKEEGLNSVIIEVDINDSLPHQTITRLEAFLEVIE